MLGKRNHANDFEASSNSGPAIGSHLDTIITFLPRCIRPISCINPGHITPSIIYLCIDLAKPKS